MCGFKRIDELFGNGRLEECDMLNVKHVKPSDVSLDFMGENFIDFTQIHRDRMEYEMQEIDAMREREDIR